MNYVGSIISNFKGFYQEINSATLNGSIDVVIVKKADGSFVSSPFHVRFGKIGVLRAREKLVDIEVNGISVPLHMKLGEAGEAFFVEQISNNDIDLPAYMATSPIPDTTHHIIEEGLRELDAHPEYWEPHSTVENPTTNPTELLLFTGIHPRPTQNKKTPRHRRRRKPKHRNNSSTSATGTEDSEFSCESDEETLFPMDLSAGDSDGSNRSTASAPCLAPALHHNDHLHHLVNSEWHGNQFASGCHPFSDGDITPITSPIGSRPPTPKSDTEYELGENCSSRLRKSSVSDSPRHITKKKPSSLIDGMDTEWKWGQLPTQSATVTAALSGSTSLSTTSKSSSRVSSTVGSVDDGKEDKIVEKTSGGLFNFMRSTKKLRHQPSQEGIYLDDLDLEAMDPEVAALYLCPSKRANKTKTTTGLADIIDGKADICVRDEVVQSTPVEASAVTIDGAIVIGDETSEATAIDAEDAESGTGDSLPRSPEPSIIQNEYDTQSSKTSAEYMTIGDDIRISLCGCHLDNEHCVKDEIFDEYMVTKECFQEKPDILFDSNLVVKIKDKYYNWQVAGPHIMAMLVFKTELPMHSMNLLKKKYMPKKERKRWWWSRSSREVKEVTSETSLTSNDKTINDTSMDKSITKSIDLAVLDASITKDDTDDSDNMISEDSYTSHEFKKSLKLNSSQIEQLRLKPGMNEVQYSVTTQYQGTTRIKSFIYLWNWDDRIIVSDIDGTITKSDVLGHVLPMIGKDWSQAGIARLYSQAASNGYKFLYLSARAIGQARITRDYLSSVVQQGDVVLPVGPMLLSPSSLISAFHKEVIEKKPEEFKIGCLRDIKALFPSSRNPFYAGFGNKINDVWAYTAVGIPISRIFTVNYKGELRQEISTALNSTYSKLYDIVDHVFPPLVKRKRGDSDDGLESLELFPNCDDFSSFTYWRLPVEIIDDVDLLNIGDTATTATTSPATNNSNTVLSSTNTNTTTDQ